MLSVENRELTNAAGRSLVLAATERVSASTPAVSANCSPPTPNCHRRYRRTWQVIRVGSIAAYLAVIATMFVRPAAGLFVFFHVMDLASAQRQFETESHSMLPHKGPYAQATGGR